MTNIASLTPMMQQYVAIKKSYEEHLLLYRLGDFYELFFEDATVAAHDLNIVLTKRGKSGDCDIPMCGIPYHAADVYIQRLLNAGHSVAICEQLESPAEAKKRGNKAVVRREVTRIITPGTLIDDNLLKDQGNIYLASIFCDTAEAESDVAISWTDISTGEFKVISLKFESLEDEISRINPRELILSDSIYHSVEFKKLTKLFSDTAVTRRPDAVFHFARAESHLQKHRQMQILSGMSDFTRNEVIASGALLEYVEHTQKNNLPRISNLQRVTFNDFMIIDKSTRDNLEILKSTFSGGVKNTLFYVLNRTRTAFGARLLRNYISTPLIDAVIIDMRLNNVEFMVLHHDLCEKLQEHLKRFGDVERALSRISARRSTIADLKTLYEGLVGMYDIAEMLRVIDIPENMRSFVNHIAIDNDLMDKIGAAVIADENEDYEEEKKDERIIKRGYSAHLDDLYDGMDVGTEKLNKLAAKYREISGVANLKVGKNNVVGYYIEVHQQNADKMKAPLFKHKQSLSNSIRFVTQELLDIESDASVRLSKIELLEQEILDTLYQHIDDRAAMICLSCFGIANIDVICSLAEVARENKYVRPVLDTSFDLEIAEGRHPVMEHNLREKFVPNNCSFNEKNSLMILTGPNMAGKSTYMRQTALICIMAQMGSFVPARSMRIGVIDRLFSRIGASDNIVRGYSTFMMEMLETAHIVQNATSRSLILMDEVGRGTSTYDGLSIASAVVEYIHKLKSRSFFATHYHELTEIAKSLEKCFYKSMRIEEFEGKIVLMHEVIDGVCDKSYGIHVAEIAGMPREILENAKRKLDRLGAEKAVLH